MSVWRDRSVYVTGASGLLGSWLVRHLVDAGAEVRCLIRDWVPQSILLSGELRDRVVLLRGDVRDQAAIEAHLGEYEVQTVFHLAAQTTVPVANRNPISTFSSNIEGTWSLLEACRRSPKVGQIVTASSDKAYGTAERLPYDESTPLAGEFPYDVSKSCADLVAQSYARTFEVPVCITRCGNFFGGGDLNWNRIVPGTIRSLDRGERPVVRSDGKFVRDYLYVEDGALAYMCLAEQMMARPELRGRAFNFSNETEVTVLELVALIQRLMENDLVPEVRNEVSAEIRKQTLDASRARSELGWKGRYGLEEGMRRTIEWYRRHLKEAA
ncbi:MAG: GDP-mannose 4,6-dehydratase [Myxococcota bacterium]